jgi:thiol-disulfide isomerase/thioredoxin
MTKPTRAQRRAAARQSSSGSTGSSGSRWLLPVAGVVLLAVGAIAWSIGQGGSGGTPGASSSSDASAVASSSTGSVAGPPVITGDPLPTFTSPTDDPASGVAAPVVQGHDDQGAEVSIEPNGRVQMVIFAAHWCPHCQREIPIIQDWVDGGGLPDDVDIVTVSTGIDASAPNYPPEAWFEREGWTAPIIVDSTGSVAQAYGLASYPYFVILDGSGDVFARFVGEIPVDELERILATVPRT